MLRVARNRLGRYRRCTDAAIVDVVGVLARARGSRPGHEGGDGRLDAAQELVLERKAEPEAAAADGAHEAAQRIAGALARPAGSPGGAGGLRACQRLVRQIEPSRQPAPEPAEIARERIEEGAERVHATATQPEARDRHEPAARRRVADVIRARIAVDGVEIRPGIT